MEYQIKQDESIQVSIRVTKTKDGSKITEITEYTVKGDPNTATYKAAWYWSILEALIKDTGIGEEKKKGLFDSFLGGR